MKKYILSLFLIIIVLPAIASKDADTANITITMNRFGNVKFVFRGEGTITIDWGNGNTSKKKIVSTDVKVFTHFYYKKSHQKISIYGNNLTHFTCNGNKITHLDVSNSKLLKYLQCSNNQLSNLDVCNNTALQFLQCSKNNLTVLDVSNNIALINLVFDKNQLTSLDVSNNSALMFINSRKNQLSAEALNVLFDTLNNVKVDGKILFIRNNPGTDTCNQKKATDKGWQIDTSFI